MSLKHYDSDKIQRQTASVQVFDSDTWKWGGDWSAPGIGEEFLMKQFSERFIRGQGGLRAGNTGMDLEWVRQAEFNPELPAPRMPRIRKAVSDSAITDRLVTDPNYFSDDSERTASVAVDYELEEQKQQRAGWADIDVIELSTHKHGRLRVTANSNLAHSITAPRLVFGKQKKMAGRGRGRGAGGGLKGATWEHDPSIKLEAKPTDLFPPHPNLRKPSPLTEKEKRQIKHYKNLQDQIHRGPLYTQPTKRDPDAPAKAFSEEQFNSQYGSNKKADMNPFLGVETYSMRYAPKKNDLPKLSDRPFNKALFPKELWSTLEGEEGEEVRKHINRAVQKKALILGDMNSKKSSDEKTKVLLEKIHTIAGDGEDGEENEEELQEEQEVDSEFDDDDLGGDYDGERYFDNGEADSEGDGGGDEEY